MKLHKVKVSACLIFDRHVAFTISLLDDCSMYMYIPFTFSVLQETGQVIKVHKLLCNCFCSPTIKKVDSIMAGSVVVVKRVCLKTV